MYNKEESLRPVGIPDELFESIERLKWVRNQLSFVRGLPEGKLRDNIQAELDSITSGSISLREKYDTCEMELKACKDEFNILVEEKIKLENKLERIHTCDNDPLVKARSGLRLNVVILLVIIAFIIGKAIG